MKYLSLRGQSVFGGIVGSLLLILLLLSIGGCSGSREALQVSQKLKNASMLAISELEKAKEADGKARKLHIELRQEFRVLFDGYQESIRNEALAKIGSSYKDALIEIEKAKGKSRKSLVEEYKASLYKIDEVLDQAVGPLDIEEARLSALADAAIQKMEQAPGDLKRQINASNVQRTYLAVAASTRDVRLRGYRRILSGIAAAEVELQSELERVAIAHRDRLTTAYEAAIGKVKFSSKAPGIGDEPHSMEPLFTAMIEYAKTTKAGSESLESYLKSKKWTRKGSFLGDFLNSGKAGFSSGILGEPEGGEAVDSETAMKEGGSVLGQLKDLFSLQVKEIISSGKEGLLELVNSASGKYLDKLKEAAEEEVVANESSEH